MKLELFINMGKHILNRINLEKLKEIIKESYSVSEVLTKCGVSNKSSNNYNKLYEIVHDHSISIDHFNRNINNKGIKKSLDDILVKNSNYTNTTQLKKYLVRDNLIEYKCSGEGCSIENTWNGKPIVLHLDHINGINNDHRIENLRFLCPNCHSQTETYAGRNMSKERTEYKKIITDLDIEPKKVKIREVKPKKESKFDKLVEKDFIQEIVDSSFVKVGKKYGVSDNTIRKWVKKFGYDPKSLRKTE